MRIPDGAEFNNPAENNRFSSVFVFHKKSRTLHNDNTLMYYDPEHLNCCLRLCGVNSRRIFFHPNLTTGGLHRFPEAVRFFKDWMRRLIDDWDFVNICTAHNGVLMHDGKKMLKLSLKRYEQKFLELSRIKSSRFQQSGRRSFSVTSSKGDKRSSLPGMSVFPFRKIALFYSIRLCLTSRLSLFTEFLSALVILPLSALVFRKMLLSIGFYHDIIIINHIFSILL